ncbi:hypothetical protein E2C01_008460 [Portunus trituberculatus]|uniref:Uncharacterized protein n=1 Tax=Portunus trituberculatus TaxID=210409 RepID=A0A5B7D0U5_PORTR|nr:hypothetical protein [Portunus trituberculatus]
MPSSEPKESLGGGRAAQSLPTLLKGSSWVDDSRERGVHLTAKNAGVEEKLHDLCGRSDGFLIIDGEVLYKLSGEEADGDELVKALQQTVQAGSLPGGQVAELRHSAIVWTSVSSVRPVAVFRPSTRGERGGRAELGVDTLAMLTSCTREHVAVFPEAELWPFPDTEEATPDSSVRD